MISRFAAARHNLYGPRMPSDQLKEAEDELETIKEFEIPRAKAVKLVFNRNKGALDGELLSSVSEVTMPCTQFY